MFVAPPAISINGVGFLYSSCFPSNLLFLHFRYDAASRSEIECISVLLFVENILGESPTSPYNKETMVRLRRDCNLLKNFAPEPVPA